MIQTLLVCNIVEIVKTNLHSRDAVFILVIFIVHVQIRRKYR